jgi:cytochrome c peroxidase
MRRDSRILGTTMRAVVAAAILLLAGVTCERDARAEGFGSLPNNFPHPNASGFSATLSDQGFVNLTTEYSQAQGSNGRSCQTCHIPQQAWSINPNAIQVLFFLTGGTHPIFNRLDANNPDTGDFDTVAGRWAAYSMMLTRGVFRRGGALRAEPRQWDLIAVDDPHGFATLNRLVQWRRVMPTINFQLGSATVNWDGGNSVGADQRAGLDNQARRNVSGAQQGPPAPLPPEFTPIINEIVDFEASLWTAQIYSFSAGFLNADGAHGGPEELSLMPKEAGAFDLFTVWATSSIPARRKIA